MTSGLLSGQYVVSTRVRPCADGRIEFVGATVIDVDMDTRAPVQAVLIAGDELLSRFAGSLNIESAMSEQAREQQISRNRQRMRTVSQTVCPWPSNGTPRFLVTLVAEYSPPEHRGAA